MGAYSPMLGTFDSDIKETDVRRYLSSTELHNIELLALHPRRV